MTKNMPLREFLTAGKVITGVRGFSRCGIWHVVARDRTLALRLGRHGLGREAG